MSSPNQGCNQGQCREFSGAGAAIVTIRYLHGAVIFPFNRP
jgi:hypothetical protein